MEALKTKIESLAKSFDPPADAELEEIPQIEKLSGYIAWGGFEGMNQRERQRYLWQELHSTLSKQEELLLSVILTLTPGERDAYLENVAESAY